MNIWSAFLRYYKRNKSEGNREIRLKEKHLKYAEGGFNKIKAAVYDKKTKKLLSNRVLLKPRKGYFDSKRLNIFDVLLIPEGILLFYYCKKPFSLGAALFSSDDHEQLLWRTAEPIWQSFERVTPLRILRSKRLVSVYLQTPQGKKTIRFSLDYLFGSERPYKEIIREIAAPILSRSHKNPILVPNPESHWECCATFNTAAICLGDRVHFIYRAIGTNGSSVLGYAASKDGIHIDERSTNPVYVPTQPFELRKDNSPSTFLSYASGGGWGGCEDPRLTIIGDTIYMTYTAFNGCEPPGVALTAISVEDFLNKKWNWKKPILISKKGEIHKNWVLMPEKMLNKFALIHSISPKVMIDYLSELEFSNDEHVVSYHGQNNEVNHGWDIKLRGIGPPPLKTEDGWLVFYHAMDKNESHRYKIGAMMLDINDPTNILYRSAKPVLAPDQHYENNGYKPHVIYSCGAVIKNGTLLVYYGGADTVICAASANLQEFLAQLKDSQLPVHGVMTSNF